MDLRSPRVKQAAVVAVVVALIWRAVRVVLSPDGLNWDFTNFYNTGARVFHGEWGNIYRRDSLIAGAERQLGGEFEYLGLPISALLWAPFGAFSPRTSLYIFKAFCLGCYIAGFFLLHRWLRRTLVNEGATVGGLAFLMLLLVCEPAWRTFDVGGQSTALAFLLLTAALSLLTPGREWAAAAALSVAIIIKPVLAVMPLVLLAGGMFPFVLKLGTWLAGEFLLSVLLGGLALHVEWIETMGARGGLWLPEGWVNSSIHVFFLRILVFLNPEYGTPEMPQPLSGLVFVIRVLMVAVMCALAWRAFRSGLSAAQKRTWVTLYAIFFALSIPVRIWEHYLLFLVPGLYYLVFHGRVLAPWARVLVAAAVVTLLRANEFFTEELTRNLITVNSLSEVVVLGAIGSGTMALMLALWIGLDPARVSESKERSQMPSDMGTA